jgi:hypothetical protein
MKYLFLILLSFSAFAEFRVDIISKNGKVNFSKFFETSLDAEKFILELDPAKVWEKGERLVPKSDCTPEELAEALEIIPEVRNEDDEIVTPEMARLPKTYSTLITDITAQVQAEKDKAEKIAKGQKARETCEKVLDLIAGYNLDRELTIEQITQMQATFANAEKALRAGRPAFAKIYINAITPDGVLVTEEMKAAALSLLIE